MTLFPSFHTLSNWDTDSPNSSGSCCPWSKVCVRFSLHTWKEREVLFIHRRFTGKMTSPLSCLQDNKHPNRKRNFSFCGKQKWNSACRSFYLRIKQMRAAFWSCGVWGGAEQRSPLLLNHSWLKRPDTWTGCRHQIHTEGRFAKEEKQNKTCK